MEAFIHSIVFYCMKTQVTDSFKYKVWACFQLFVINFNSMGIFYMFPDKDFIFPRVNASWDYFVIAYYFGAFHKTNIK